MKLEPVVTALCLVPFVHVGFLSALPGSKGMRSSYRIYVNGLSSRTRADLGSITITSSTHAIRELSCDVTVYGPTVPLGPVDRAACIVQATQRGNRPDGLYYQPGPDGVRAYAFYDHSDRARWMDPGSGSRVFLSPSLFVVDAARATRAVPLASERWAVSADGSRVAFAFGYYDGEDHEFTPAWGYVNCKVDVWDVSTATRLTSTELDEVVPDAVAFDGERVLVNYDERGRPLSGLARVERKGDWSDRQMELPGGAGRVPVIPPLASVVLPAAGGRLFVPETRSLGDGSQENVPIWLDDQGSAPIPASQGEWTAMMGVGIATTPLVWSPSAACFVTGPKEGRQVVERSTGRILFVPPSRYVHAITDDGARAVVTLEEPRGDGVVESHAIVSRDRVAMGLKTATLSKFAFSRGGDRLFVSDDLNPASETPCRCYDAATGEVVWETSLPIGARALTGGAAWSADDGDVLVGVQRGLLILGGSDGAIRGRLTLGDFLPYLLAASGDAIFVRAESLFLAIS